MSATRRVVACIVTAVTATAIGSCSSATGEKSGAGANGAAAQKGARAASVGIKLIGDGSTAYTGRQPDQPPATRLAPGQQPPQFVVFSWDGAGQDSQRLFSRFRAIGKKYDAKMTYFLSGVYLLPTEKRTLYDPPQHAPGASDIGFNDVKGVKATVEQLRLAWQEGNEIGTHFNGHFCGPNGGVGTWSPAEWKSEIRQARAFVGNWKTNSGLTDEPPLPFDYARELAGGRAPCLEGQKNLITAAKEMGFRYDASSSGGRQTWPATIDGIWDFPLQQVPMPGRAIETLSMDYNFLANQSGTVRGDPSQHAVWGRQMRDGLLAAFDRAYHGNRAPLFIGNHFESWNGGTYMRAVEDTIKAVCLRRGVHCVTFKQLTDWLDAQDPRVLKKLRTLDVGQRPEEGWEAFLAAQPTAPPDSSPGSSASPDSSPGSSASPDSSPGSSVEPDVPGVPDALAASPVRPAAG